MSAMFGVWPPQGKAGAVQAFGRAKAAVQITSAGAIVASTNLFNNITSVVRNGAGDYTVTFNFDLLPADIAQVQPVTAGRINAVVQVAAANTVQVLTFDAAGVAADGAFNLSVLG